MLNLHQNIINNYINNAVCEELDKEWADHISPESRSTLIHGYYNAGILVINLSELNNEGFYDSVIRKNFEKSCEQLYKKLKPVLETTLRRMFKGFNRNLTSYDVVLFMEGSEEDELTPVKYNIKIF